MNDIERRTLIGAVGIGALAAISKAGPLNPPAGAVAPTGRTLDEVYDKIPGANGSGDGRIPIPGGSANVFITTPGSYILTGNIDTATTCITIIASKVTLDLNGFHLTNSTSASTAVVALSGNLSGITIRNGTLNGGLTGIIAVSPQSTVLLEDLRIVRARQSGISLNDSGNRGFIFRRCHVIETGITTTGSDSTLVVTAINLGGDAHRVEDCTVSRIYNFTPAGTIRGIVVTGAGANSGVMVERCFITHEVALTGTGLQMSTGGAYRGNTVLTFSTPYSVALNTDCGGNF